VAIESAGTHGFHVGKAPDRRAEEAARRRGYAMADLRARQVGPADLATFDYVIAMDEANYASVEELTDGASRARLVLLMDYVEDAPRRDVPDPYYGGPNGFEEVLDLVEAASDAVIAALRRDHGLA
jgi:protein-tyrosine phosphatase